MPPSWLATSLRRHANAFEDPSLEAPAIQLEMIQKGAHKLAMKSHESNPCLQQLCLAKKIQKGDKILKRWQFWWQHKAGTASHTCASHWHITSLPITLHINCNSLALRINITSKSEKHDALNSYMYLYRNMSISDIKHKIPEIQLLYNYIYIYNPNQIFVSKIKWQICNLEVFLLICLQNHLTLSKCSKTPGMLQ